MTALDDDAFDWEKSPVEDNPPPVMWGNAPVNCLLSFITRNKMGYRSRTSKGQSQAGHTNSHHRETDHCSRNQHADTYNTPYPNDRYRQWYHRINFKKRWYNYLTGPATRGLGKPGQSAPSQNVYHFFQ